MIALLLKSKKVHLFIIGFLMIGNILFFQNCSNKQYISPNLLTNASNETSSGALMPVLPTPVLTVFKRLNPHLNWAHIMKNKKIPAGVPLQVPTENYHLVSN